MAKKAEVTVICIAFNHEKWIEKALVSVLLQDHEDKKLIVVDNGSSDGTASIIRTWVESNSEKMPITAIYQKESIPYCQLFNKVLDKVESPFVIDLSGDDFLYENHLSLSVIRLEQTPGAAFVFSDATILDENGDQIAFYNSKDYKEIEEKLQSNEMYETLICRSYISSPTVVFDSLILKKVGGYDAYLTYEDFDIHLRLARDYPLAFSGHIGVLKRKHSKSLSANQYRRYQSDMLPSTLRVCQKIKEMNRTSSEDEALRERVLFELKHSMWSANFQVARGFVNLAEELKVKELRFSLFKLWLKFRIDISWLYVKLT
ncbi:glycosyltransferase [uncultured Algoriphagus sp.]|uniref:glycosyltransferase n=1 Tax=uncultured Algoriphagus sp. TaxID=417365 RepID=UPI0030EE58C3|tara:strand:- start:138094 stop:139044 length:951 start_codon:yes stop_codon:yes gene_type:complete